MKLKALRLHGFKSFADRTEIVFHDGITAIVGPNGCGKSNISDAIRWVLGEQRPTAIRGAKMEEAIFQGTVSRRPVNRGSVAIEVMNADGALPVPYQEVEISRTVYRDGGSDYFLNRSPCRLRDIQELCRDTGLGANAYAVIENRMIDAILSDRAEERRGLFEEAAGIGKYKDRRKAAGRRLERAELDLQRLEDLISEIGTKVRSLARQRGKAERYRELRKRRLDVEVAVVRDQLERWEARLAEVRDLLAGGLVRDEGLQARVTAEETRVESLRAGRLDAERERTRLAGRVDELRTSLVEWERELAVAGERAGQADRRLGQIETERAEARERAREIEAGEGELLRRKEEVDRELDRAQSKISLHEEETGRVREALAKVRGAVHEVENRERELVRRMAQLQGDAEASESRAGELSGRMDHLERELGEAREALAEMASQGDLFTDRVASLRDEVEAARARLEALRVQVAEEREQLQSARDGELAAQDAHGTLATRRAALARMERDREGVGAAVQGVLSNPPDGVEGILVDFLSAPREVSGAVEAYLGVLTRAIVVRDSQVGDELARWFQDEWKDGGGLVVLPLDRVPTAAGQGSLLDRVTASGAGAPWVKALLDGVALAAPGPSSRGGMTAANLVTEDGGRVERDGVLRLGNPLGATGILERKARLRTLEEEVATAEEALALAKRDREACAARLAALEVELEVARTRLGETEDAAREARAQEAARSDRNERLERTVEELEGQLAMTRTARERSAQRVVEALGEREGLRTEEEGLRARRAESRDQLDRVQNEWEEVRAQESALTVERTRLEGEQARLEERLQNLIRGRASALARIEALNEEERGLQEEREDVRRLREEGASETGHLFELRTDAERQLEEKDRALAALDEVLGDAERKVKEARASEREASERRHVLELEGQELEGRTGRIRDRLEAEWGRPFDRLVAEAGEVEGDEQELRAELRGIVEALERIGPVNMLAVEEHEEESSRLAFLTEQRDDLTEARNDLREAIREINLTATELFSETFEAIRVNFRETFLHLFEGGECDLRLADPADPLESDVDIHATPRGKRTQRIDLLSGGERALTALSLLFGIYLVKPSPFCVLDEVDAPLDESNIGRFIRLLQQFKGKSQFVVITHNPRTIEAADWIYGVTMEEPGVSTIVGVRLDEALEVAGV